VTDELKNKIEKKKAAQHQAWKRWYAGPKGQAYRQKLKQKRALNEEG
jgi:hypothetical protein